MVVLLAPLRLVLQLGRALRKRREGQCSSVCVGRHRYVCQGCSFISLFHSPCIEIFSVKYLAELNVL
jgi:hypothetical protein